MKKTIVGLLLLVFCVTVLASCAKKEKPVPYDETKTESQETEPVESQEAEPAETTKKDLEPGIERPEDWPEDVPTPVTGEFTVNAWIPEMNLHTFDIIYTQKDVDAYAKRLQNAGFKKIDNEKDELGFYEGLPHNTYTNDKWKIVLGDEIGNGGFSFIDLYPLK
ncbi:MAG: hypothetical protein ACOX75_04445 [Lachnospiraceae bacterium]|jgi:hypothetical protein